MGLRYSSRLVLLLLALAYAPSHGVTACTPLNKTVVAFGEKKVVLESKLPHGVSVSAEMEAVMYVQPEPGFGGAEVTAILETLTGGLGQSVLATDFISSSCFNEGEMQAVLMLMDVEQHVLGVLGSKCTDTTCNMKYNATAFTSEANTVVRGLVVTAHGPSIWTTHVTDEGCPPKPRRSTAKTSHNIICAHVQKIVQPAAPPAAPATPPPPREVLDGCTAASEITVSYGEAKVVMDRQVTDGEVEVEVYMLVRPEPGFAGVMLTATMETLAEGRRQSISASSHFYGYCFEEGTWEAAVALTDVKRHILGAGGGGCWLSCNMHHNSTALTTTANTVLRGLVVTAYGPSRWTTQVTGEECPSVPSTRRWGTSRSCRHELLHPPATPSTPLSLHDAVTIGIVAALLAAAAATLLVALLLLQRLTAFFDYHKGVVGQGMPLMPMNQPGTSARP